MKKSELKALIKEVISEMTDYYPKESKYLNNKVLDSVSDSWKRLPEDKKDIQRLIAYAMEEMYKVKDVEKLDAAIKKSADDQHRAYGTQYTDINKYDTSSSRDALIATINSIVLAYIHNVLKK